MSLLVNGGLESRGRFALSQDLGKVCLLLCLLVSAELIVCVLMDELSGPGIQPHSRQWHLSLLRAGTYQWPLVPWAQVTGWLENENCVPAWCWAHSRPFECGSCCVSSRCCTTIDCEYSCVSSFVCSGLRQDFLYLYLPGQP